MDKDFASLRMKLETAQNWLIRVVLEKTNSLQVPARLLLRELWHLIVGLKAEKYHDFCMCYERFVSCFQEESLPPGLPTVTEIFHFEKVLKNFSTAVIEGTIPFQFRYPSNSSTIATISSRSILGPVIRKVLSKAEKLKDIDFEKCRGAYFNVIVEIIGLFRTSNNFVILRVWDGTKIRNTASLYSATNHIEHIMYANKCYMENVPSEYLMDITVHDDAVDQASQYQAGDIVAIANLHNYHKPGGGNIWPTLHSIEKGRRFDRGFYILPPSAQQYRELHKLTKSVLSGESSYDILNDMCGTTSPRIRKRESQLPKENVTEVVTIEDTPDIIMVNSESQPTLSNHENDENLVPTEEIREEEQQIAEAVPKDCAETSVDVTENKEHSVSFLVNSVVNDLVTKIAEEPQIEDRIQHITTEDPDYAAFVEELMVTSTQNERPISPQQDPTFAIDVLAPVLVQNKESSTEEAPVEVSNSEPEKNYTLSREVDTIVAINQEATVVMEQEELPDTLPPNTDSNVNTEVSRYRRNVNLRKSRKRSEDVQIIEAPTTRRSSRLKKVDVKRETADEDEAIVVQDSTFAVKKSNTAGKIRRSNRSDKTLLVDIKQEAFMDEVQMLGASRTSRSIRKRKVAPIKLETIDDAENDVVRELNNLAKRKPISNETREISAYTVSEEVDTIMEDEPILSGNAGFKAEMQPSQSDTAMAQFSYDGADEQQNSSLRTFAAEEAPADDFDLSIEELDNTVEPTVLDRTVNNKENENIRTGPAEEFWKVLKSISDDFVKKTKDSMKPRFRFVKNDGPLLQFVPAGTIANGLANPDTDDSFERAVFFDNSNK